jgi:hypothetical protein
MIEKGRYKGEIGFVARGGNGYYAVVLTLTSPVFSP